jgi:hypothetical protein
MLRSSYCDIEEHNRKKQPSPNHNQVFGIQRSFSSAAAGIIKIEQEVPARNRAGKSKFSRRLCRFQFGSKSAFEKCVVPDCFNEPLLNFPAANQSCTQIRRVISSKQSVSRFIRHFDNLRRQNAHVNALATRCLVTVSRNRITTGLQCRRRFS